MTKPTEEEILQRQKDKETHEAKRKELGISKSQYKKILKQEQFEASKTEYRKIQRDKRKKRKNDDEERKPKEKRLRVDEQNPTGVKFIVDCEFDDLMNDKEINSLSNQITRIYSSKRICKYDLPVTVTSFGGKLQKRFEKAIEHYVGWKDFTITPESLQQLKDDNDKTGKYGELIYLTADTDEVIETLEDDKTYIIGGIVDKNRHKSLCVNKAKQLGLKVGKLPIDKYIEMNARHVLATSHVYEICCKWYELGNWKDAFNAILPKRKLIPKKRVRGGKKQDISTESPESTESPATNSNEETNLSSDQLSDVPSS
ncbi:tRNA (guanine(9)-N1)-methyltransferase [[Candida] jaroonii]|uniref:tRNA (Guanine(9)-N1)-methyltransferase n=1 Tax=[Candida] jaroonii TaxID=467808 RepID=A0ACA9Y1P1_9ASCO|nr:tRNA (guanine(9)-N1)-methyltransferase [[Candida] jaroonii]